MLQILHATPAALLEFVSLEDPGRLNITVRHLFQRAVWCWNGPPGMEKQNRVRRLFRDWHTSGTRAGLELDRVAGTAYIPAAPEAGTELVTADDVKRWFDEYIYDTDACRQCDSHSEVRAALLPFFRYSKCVTICDRYIFQDPDAVAALLRLVTDSDAISEVRIRTAMHGDPHAPKRSESKVLEATRKLKRHAKKFVRAVPGRSMTVELSQTLGKEYHSRAGSFRTAEGDGPAHVVTVDPGFKALKPEKRRAQTVISWLTATRTRNLPSEWDTLRSELELTVQSDYRGELCSTATRLDPYKTIQDGDVAGDVWVRGIEDLLGCRVLDA